MSYQIMYRIVWLPVTTITIIFVGSSYKTRYRTCRYPTKMMVLVVEGTSRLDTDATCSACNIFQVKALTTLDFAAA